MMPKGNTISKNTSEKRSQLQHPKVRCEENTVCHYKTEIHVSGDDSSTQPSLCYLHHQSMNPTLRVSLPNPPGKCMVTTILHHLVLKGISSKPQQALKIIVRMKSAKL
jgi:hypothetical protein